MALTLLEARRRRRDTQEERQNKVYTAAKGACVAGDTIPLLLGWVISRCSVC